MGVTRAVARTMQTKDKPASGTGGTPIWVWVVYALGIFAATVVVGMSLFTIGALYLSSEGDAYKWSVSATLLVWCAPIVIALALLIYRRRP